MRIFDRLILALMEHDATHFLLASLVCLRNGCRLKRDSETFVISKGRLRIRIHRRHLDYSAHITHHFETYFSQVTPEGNEADYSRPRIHTLANGMKFELSSLPEESPALDSYFRHFRPRPGDTVFDIGAYCGVFTYAVSRIVGQTGRVIAFEPDPVNAGVLRRNIERHSLQNVTVVQAAVCDKDGWAQFNCHASLGSTLIDFVDRPKPRAFATVQTITLKTACERFGVPAFVKIDAEGAEIEILSGAIPCLRDHQISFVLDTDHMRDGHLTNTRVEHLFSEANYCAESSTATGFMTTWATPASVNTQNS